MYAPRIDEGKVDSNTNACKGISLSELMKKPEIHEAYENNRTLLPMEALVDRVIKIRAYEVENKENYKGEKVDMVTMHYTIEDDDREKATVTQSKAILEVLSSIPKEVFQQYGYVTGMIQMKKLPNGGRSYSFVL